MDMGYQPVLAESGAQAAKIFPACSPQLVLLDISMPEMNGFELCRILKENPDTREVPVIFISAMDEAEDIVRGEASERDCFYYLRDNLHKLSQEVAVLAEDLAERESENRDRGRMNALKEYIQMISEEMAILDSKVKDENVTAEDD